MNLKTSLLLLSVLLLTACTVHRPPAASDQTAPLAFDKGQTWQLVSLRGKPMQQSTTITLVLNSETATLHGHATCNRYFADIKQRLLGVDAEGTRYGLDISYFGKDNVSCPEADMNLEERYFALLPKADACLLTPYTLTLFRGGKEILKYELQ